MVDPASILSISSIEQALAAYLIIHYLNAECWNSEL
jgi:hypothetical protein